MSDGFIERISAVLGDGYVVERELGAGMSRVVVARDVALGRRVVVKVLPSDWAAGLSAERFRREVVLAAGLQHPHIVPLLSAAEADDGTLYYMMPFVNGQSLRTRLGEGLPALGDALRWLRDVASALAYAHERGVVHRDMKPDNILLSGAYAVVADFGIAKALRNASATMSRVSAAVNPITTIGMSMGTPAYMAPEQVAADADADHRTDLYALGVIAYELLSGDTPFTGSAQAILTAHLTTEPEDIADRRPGLPQPLTELVMRCLAKEAADRPQRASEVVTELEALLRTVTPDDHVAPPAASAMRATGGTKKRAPATPRSKVMPIGIAAVAVSAAVAAASFWPPSIDKALPLPNRVVVAPFRDASADSSLTPLARSIASAITTDLSALVGSDVVAPAEVERAEKAAAAGDASPLALASAVRAGLVVAGEVSLVGTDTVAVRTSLVSGTDGKQIRAFPEVRATRADLVEAMAEMRQRIAGAVTTATAPEFTHAMLSSGMPPLMPAVQALREGLQLEAGLRQPDPKEDESLAELVRFDRALKADPEFTQARLWFASAALRRPGGEVLADSAIVLVQEQLEELTEYERALLDALRADASGNHELSVRGWRRARTLAPSWPNRWWLAMKLRDNNRPREALAIIDTLGRDDVHFTRSVPSLRHYVGEFAAEYRALREEQARAPSTAQSLGFQQALLQSLAALDSVTVIKRLLDDASQLPSEPGSSLAYVLLRTSWELSAHRHRAEGTAALQRAVAWCSRRTASDLQNGAVAFDCIEAYGYSGDATALSTLAEPALRERAEDIDIAVLGIVGLAAALRGERSVAEQFATRIAQGTRADGSRGLASWTRARIAAALGDTGRAIELLEDAFSRGAGWSQRLDLHRDPAFDKLRGIAAFERLRVPQG